MLHYAPYQMLHHCSAIRISVVSPYKAVLYGPLMPLQDGALLPNKTVLYSTSPPTRWCLMPRLRNGAQPTHDPTISSSPDQTLKSEDNILLNPNQTRIKSTIESRSHDCNPVMFCIKHWCPLMIKFSQPLYVRQVCVHTNAIKPFLGSAAPIVNAWP